MEPDKKTLKAVDTVIPIVFPDYLITVIEKPTKVDVLPGFSFDNFTIPKTSVPELGHAGVLFFSSAGLTKYYEYGRYDSPTNLGKVRNVTLPNLEMIRSKPTFDSLVRVLSIITKTSGQNGRIEGAYIEVPGKFNTMLNYARVREAQNNNPKRKPYSITDNSCIHFVKGIVESAGVGTPWMFDCRPNSYIGEFRDDFPDVDFSPSNNKLVIEQ